MTQDTTRVQYDLLHTIAHTFGTETAAIEAVTSAIDADFAPLHAGDWHGPAAHSFFAEMQAAIFPALDRLTGALAAAQSTTTTVLHLFADAEADAASLFHGTMVYGGKDGNGGNGGASTSPDDPDVTDVRGDDSKDVHHWWGATDEYRYLPKYAPFQGQVTTDGISPSDISQGRIGDCYFIAALASVAQQHPEVIANAIHDNGDSTYTVTLYDKDGAPVQVTVDNDFPVTEDINGNPTHNPAYALFGSTPDELWPMIMEKAYAKYHGNSYDDIVGGYPENALQTLTGKTGHEIDSADINLQDLQNRLNSGEYVTAGTGDKHFWETWPEHIEQDHAYSIEKIDVQNNLIYLRNPWGTSYNPDPLTPEEFKECFDHVAYNN